MELTKEAVQIRYFSGYIRSWRALCAELGIPTDLSRDEREQSILKKAYEKWGLSMTEHLYGMFAIVLRDDRSGKCYAIRDHVGQKQLFYAEAGGEFLCSGDINAIAADPRFEKRLNRRMLQQYLFYGYPIGSQTFYEGIYKLMPGHYAEWDGKEVRVRRYWKPSFEPDRTKTPEEFADEIRRVVDEIMAEEKGDDKLPYKESFLSGGVDSSYLLAAGDAACANTVGYEEAGFDESDLAKKTAETLGRGFRVKVIGAQEYFDRIPQTIEKIGQPLGDASAVAFSLGCAAVRRYAEVVYSGEGIDEFFGGYKAHQREIPPEWTYLTCSHIYSLKDLEALLIGYDKSIDVAEPIADIWKEVQGQSPLAQKLTVDISLWLEGDIYLNTDRTSTACGVELHTPFSDLRLFNVARRIPAEYQFNGEQNKYVFRMAASDKLPHEAAFRKKVGFPVPVRDWLADERYNKPVADKLFGESSKKFFHQEEMRRMWTSFIGGEKTLWNRVYAIYVFLLWYDINFR